MRRTSTRFRLEIRDTYDCNFCNCIQRNRYDFQGDAKTRRYVTASPRDTCRRSLRLTFETNMGPIVRRYIGSRSPARDDVRNRLSFPPSEDKLSGRVRAGSRRFTEIVVVVATPNFSNVLASFASKPRSRFETAKGINGRRRHLRDDRANGRTKPSSKD